MAALRLVLLSDTHQAHERLTVPPADVVLHAGDFTRRGTPAETETFLTWLAALPAPHKVLVAGNHDYFAEREPARMAARCAELGLHYLVDSEVTCGGLRIWGSPVTPVFHDMAFNRPRGEVLARHWAAIPSGLDVLLTHGPPHGLGDRVFHGARVGCEALLDAVRRARPRLHVFGHIHEDPGESRDSRVETRFLNVSSVRLGRLGVRPPVCVELEPAASGAAPAGPGGAVSP